MHSGSGIPTGHRDPHRIGDSRRRGCRHLCHRTDVPPLPRKPRTELHRTRHHVRLLRRRLQERSALLDAIDVTGHVIVQVVMETLPAARDQRRHDNRLTSKRLLMTSPEKNRRHRRF